MKQHDMYVKYVFRHMSSPFQNYFLQTVQVVSKTNCYKSTESRVQPSCTSRD